jgi:hypothetical protein
MRKQDIEIVIAPDGKVSFTIKGVKGPDCLSETKFLEDALGGEVLDRQKTGEYYEQSETYGSVTVGEGGED